MFYLKIYLILHFKKCIKYYVTVYLRLVLSTTVFNIVNNNNNNNSNNN